MFKKGEKPGKTDKGTTYVEMSYRKGNSWLSNSGAISVCLHDFEWGIDFNSNPNMAHSNSIPQIGFPKTDKYFYF